MKKEELLDQIRANFDVVELIDQGPTAGGKIKEYDLWHRDADGIIRYKRLHIYIKNSVAEWYSENPIPKVTQPQETFGNRVRNYIKEKIGDETIQAAFVILIDESIKRAVCEAILQDNTQKKMLVYTDNKNTLNHKLIVQGS